MRRAKTTRELRRQKARNDRKILMEMDSTPAEKLQAAFFRNGITLDDLKREYMRGAKEGRKLAEDYAFQTIYAAFLITMIDHHGMDADEAVDLLIEIDHQTVACVENSELIEEAYRKTGIQLNWDEAIERIERGVNK